MDFNLDNDDFVEFKPKKSSERQVFEYELDGVKVYLPFAAYQCQEQMMDKMIRALNGHQEHALLESPTGSGKSMAILCAAMAWLSKEYSQKEGAFLEVDGKSSKQTGGFRNKKGRRVFITSRTHSQIAQLVMEMKRTIYKPSFVVLGSRKYYCINDSVMEHAERENTSLNDECRNALRLARDPNRRKDSSFMSDKVQLDLNGQRANERIMPFCELFSSTMETAKALGVELKSNSNKPHHVNMDMEDLLMWGRQENSCPYFASRLSMNYASIIFAPYNYLVDPSIRKSMSIELTADDAIIVDEAHNIEDVCREAGSFDIVLRSLASMENIFKGEIKKIQEGLSNRTLSGGDSINKILAHLSECAEFVAIMRNWLGNHSMTSSRSQVRKDFEESLLFWSDQNMVQELVNAGITAEKLKKMECALEHLSSSSSSSSNDRDGDNRSAQVEFTCNLPSATTHQLQSIVINLLRVLHASGQFVPSYRMVVKTLTVDIRTSNGVARDERKIWSMWCMDPQVIFRELSSIVNAIILTSGTLSPMETLCTELGVNFQHRLEADHVIGKDQILARCVPRGLLNTNLKGVFQIASTFDYQDDISASIVKACSSVPGGVLVFVPSYAFLDRLKERMVVKKDWAKLVKLKQPFVEPRFGTAQEFTDVMNAFYQSTKDPSKWGAILFAVYRGKISEGIDLKDDYCRAVIIVGIPYPAFKDPAVVLKREFNDRCHHQSLRGMHTASNSSQAIRRLSGSEWYGAQAFRALNQALGRCIRHVNDWGSILLFDERFSYANSRRQLSHWVREDVKVCTTFDAMIEELQQFSMNNCKNPPSRQQSFTSSVGFRKISVDQYAEIEVTRFGTCNGLFTSSEDGGDDDDDDGFHQTTGSDSSYLEAHDGQGPIFEAAAEHDGNRPALPERIQYEKSAEDSFFAVKSEEDVIIRKRVAKSSVIYVDLSKESDEDLDDMDRSRKKSASRNSQDASGTEAAQLHTSHPWPDDAEFIYFD